jgi:D-alanyl-D-alanine-carboxypeptidase/D-alanyl-D-alanine-endopeptidase
MYMYNFGEQHKGQHDLPTAQTLYEIASITKTFTGTLLAKAVLEHRIKLEDDIRKYLGGDYPNLEYQGHFITVAMLLNHRSGLPYMLPDDPIFKTGDNLATTRWEIDSYKHYTKADFFRDLHQIKLDTVPGAKFGYSNAAAMLCSYILEKLYVMSYDELLKQQLTAGLKMYDTKIKLSAQEKKRLAAGYDEKGMLMPYSPDELEGAGALKSDVADMLKYIRWHLDEKNHPAARLCHDPTWQSGNYWAGLNWQVLQAADKKRLIWQSGDLVGFASYCALYPEANLGIVVMTNEEDRHAPGLIEKLIDPIAAYLEPGAIPFP